MEVCGILSFNLSPKSLEELFIGFASRFNVEVLFPKGDGEEVCFTPAGVLELMQRRLSFGDALIAEVARIYRRWLDFFVTWNTVHFEGRLPLRVVRPDCLWRGGGGQVSSFREGGSDAGAVLLGP